MTLKIDGQKAVMVVAGGGTYDLGTVESEDLFGRRLLTPTDNFWHFWEHQKQMMKDEGFAVDKASVGVWQVFIRRPDLIEPPVDFMEVHPDTLLKEAEAFLRGGRWLKDEMGYQDEGWDIDSIRSATMCSLNSKARRWEYIGGVPLLTLMRRNTAVFDEVADEQFLLIDRGDSDGHQLEA